MRWLVLLLVAAAALALGAGLWLSALNVLYRDVRYTIGFALQFWLFVSPIVFPSSLVDDEWRWALALNPMTGLLDGFRWATLDAAPPPAADAVSAAVALLLLVSGLAFFHRVERSFADRI